MSEAVNRMAATTRGLALTVSLGFGLAVRAAAQCPDGTPPPCSRSAGRAAPAANTVAVLYFENATRDTADAYLADGLTEEIITRLAGIERLAVRSRYVVTRFRGSALRDPAAVGRALGVTYLVSGSIRRAGGRLRVNAELIRAGSATQVWGRQFDQQGGDVFAIQEAVASEIATGIVGRLLPGEVRALAARPTASAAAYEAYLRGNFHVARRDSSGVRRGIREYETALREDPGFTDALSRLSWAYGIAYSNGIDIGEPEDSLAARAIRTAEAAVGRAPASSDAWLAMGLARITRDPVRLSGAREALERAIALDPANAEPHHLLGFFFQVTGADSVGLMHDRHALAIHPGRAVTLMHFVSDALRRGDCADARRWADSALVVEPGFEPARAVLLPLAWLLSGDTAAARAQWAALRPGPGRRPHMYVGGYLAMVPLVADGDAPAALDILESLRPRGAFLRSFLLMPAYAPLHDHPRYQRLLAEVTP